MKEFIDKTIEQNGTPINRETMMALQGFVSNNVVFNDDGSITETNGFGETKTTIFNDDGSITEIYVGQKTITKNIIFENDGTITEIV